MIVNLECPGTLSQGMTNNVRLTFNVGNTTWAV